MGHTASYYYVGLSPGAAVRHCGPLRPQPAAAERLAVPGRRPGDAERVLRRRARASSPSRPGAPAARWAAGSPRRSTPSTISRASRCASPAWPGRSCRTWAASRSRWPVARSSPRSRPAPSTPPSSSAPTDDLILGLDELGSDLFYYHPGWWEPGTALEVQIPLTLWDELPATYQAAVRNAAGLANMNTMATYDVLNQRDLQEVKTFAEIREFSPRADGGLQRPRPRTSWTGSPPRTRSSPPSSSRGGSSATASWSGTAWPSAPTSPSRPRSDPWTSSGGCGGRAVGPAPWPFRERAGAAGAAAGGGRRGFVVGGAGGGGAAGGLRRRRVPGTIRPHPMTPTGTGRGPGPAGRTRS